MMFSADNHICEPVDAWQKRMSSKMQDRAPRYARDGENIVGYIDGEVRQVINAKAFGADLLPEDANDVEARLQVLERDGLWGEALLGNLSGVVVMSIEEPEFALECARAYNDYLAESFGPYRDRVVGHAYSPTCIDPRLAVAEIERAASIGLRSIIVPLWPAEPYYLRKFDPIWEAAAAHNMPVTMHAHTGRWFRKLIWNDLPEPIIVNASGVDDDRDRIALVTAGGGISMPQQGYQALQVAGWFIGSGALERHPNLQLVFLECGSAWLMSAGQWFDEVWTPVPGMDRIDGPLASISGAGWPYEKRPSEYLRRQVHTTFQDETAAIANRHKIGLDALMWGADVPHPEGTWPRSKSITTELFRGVPDDEVQAITGGTFAKLFGLTVPA
jgi:predicted TIM-barrel fold metal-dependent hydrolase